MQTISIIQSLGLLLLSVGLVLVSGFQAQNGNSRIIGGVCPLPLLLLQSSTHLKLSSEVNSDFERPSTFLDDDDDDDMNVEFYDDDDDDDEEEKEVGAGRKRWDNLKPTIKKRLVEKGRAKAIANKKKREPIADKKRREFLHYFFISLICNTIFYTI
jgi:hypothetical protein